jgi:protein SCO1/2
MHTATRLPLSVPQSLIWGTLVLVLLGVAGFGSWTLLAPYFRREGLYQLPVYGTVPPFSLIERSGQPLAAEDLVGKIWVANFIFTHCPGMCPALTARMAGLQKTLRDTPVLLVSFSVDPERDTPEALTRYAERYRADTKQWLFLTGKREDLYQLILEGFRVSVAHLPPDDPRLVNEPIVHSDRFVLVDPRLQIRGYYRGTETESVAHLLRDVKALQREHH